MLNVTTDWSRTLIVLMGITPEGIKHYQGIRRARRCFVNISDSADELIGAILANEQLRKNGRRNALFDEGDERVEDFQELSRNGLLNVHWADDKAYFYEATDKGRIYVDGTFEDEVDALNIQVNPTFNNTVLGSSAESAANATVTNVVSITAVFGSIRESALSEEEKREAELVIVELTDAASGNKVDKFAKALKRVAGIVENANALGKTVLPYAAQMIGQLFQ